VESNVPGNPADEVSFNLCLQQVRVFRVTLIPLSNALRSKRIALSAAGLGHDAADSEVDVYRYGMYLPGGGLVV
jgi:hypothetical protein